MKNIYFLSSVPRAGNTLLGSIINKSKFVKLTANSILIDIIKNLKLFKESETYFYKNQKKSLFSDKHSRKFFKMSFLQKKIAQKKVWDI